MYEKAPKQWSLVRKSFQAVESCTKKLPSSRVLYEKAPKGVEFKDAEITKTQVETKQGRGAQRSVLVMWGLYKVMN